MLLKCNNVYRKPDTIRKRWVRNYAHCRNKKYPRSKNANRERIYSIARNTRWMFHKLALFQSRAVNVRGSRLFWIRKPNLRATLPPSNTSKHSLHFWSRQDGLLWVPEPDNGGRQTSSGAIVRAHCQVGELHGDNLDGPKLQGMFWWFGRRGRLRAMLACVFKISDCHDVDRGDWTQS